MDYQTLKCLKPSEFEEAADGYRTCSDMATEAKDRVNSRITASMREGLEGRAADKALEQLQDLSKNFHYAQVECGLVSTSLNALASDLLAAKKKLDTAVQDACDAGLTVNSDGSVTYPEAGEVVDGKVPPGGTVTGTARGTNDTAAPIDPSRTANDTATALERQAASFNPNPKYAQAVEFANRISTAVQEATEADEVWSPKLRELKADDDLTVSHRDWSDTRKDMLGVRKGAKDYLENIKAPPEDGTPEENASWWDNLSEQERADYVTLQPASVGALDGLPAEVRDEANRTVLAEKQGTYATHLAGLGPEPAKYVPGPSRRKTDEWVEWSEKKERLESTINGMSAIQDRFDRTGENGLPEAYLLGFDPEGHGDGRIILANGNPDTADHTSVYVPGTGTDLGGIRGDLERGEITWRESQRLAPSQSVSTITWLDYNAPDTIPQATQSSYAIDGAPTLNKFLDGVQTAQGGDDSSHTTVIGHSYGTTVVGESAKHAQIAADDILVAGSPGMQVEHASELGVGSNHVWAMGADWTVDDALVRHGGRLVGLGEDWANPTDENFGGNVIEAGSTGLKGHSDFWDHSREEVSTALKNQARVITGRYEDVELEAD